MPRRRAERGEGNIGCILWLLALGIALLIAWKAVPVKMQSAELYDFMDEAAKFRAERTPTEELEKQILERAKQLNIPLEKKNVRVERKAGDRIYMEVEYTIPVEFPGYTYPWHFRQTLDRPIFSI
ncbi:MAG TPA: hypothetical protein VGX68_25110 [Thermoanaerobaculia bacterium]|jgi:hypothetical protein|nr:hypothetical protein [Thermoanaerobaculia bacterium]